MAASSVVYFATAPCTDPNAVVLVNPADLAPDVSPEVIDFEWQEHTSYPTFELELSETADFTDSDGDGVADDVLLYIPIDQYTQGSAPGLSRYTYDDTERTENSGQGLILPESTYYWRMRGCGPSVCVEGDTEIGPWSNVFSFTTDISRPAPIPKGIRQDITNVSPRRITEMEPDRAVPIIAWTTVTDATGYEVQLTTRETDGEADFTEPMVLELALTALLSDTELSLYSDNPKLFGDNAPVDVLTSEGYLLDGLAGGETYYWRVAAEFGEHGQGSWSEPWTFGTAPVSMKFFYYLKDHLGSVRATVNGHGNVVHYDDYYPFGLQMPERTEISDAPLERYTGHELDSETGQYYAGGRYYGPLGGRWLSLDPLADQYASLSPYNYVFNNPMLWTDPTGKDPCDTDGDGEIDAFCLDEIVVEDERPSYFGEWEYVSGSTFTAFLYAYYDELMGLEYEYARDQSSGDYYARQIMPHLIGADGEVILLNQGEPPVLGRGRLPGGRIYTRGFRPRAGTRTIQGQVDAAVHKMGGNPTVQRGGQDLFRLRSRGHGSNRATATPQNVRNISPEGRVFFGKGPDRSVTQRDIRELYKAQTGIGTSRIRTRSGQKRKSN